jgi:hypothetical protein
LILAVNSDYFLKLRYLDELRLQTVTKERDSDQKDRYKERTREGRKRWMKLVSWPTLKHGSAEYEAPGIAIASSALQSKI